MGIGFYKFDKWVNMILTAMYEVWSNFFGIEKQKKLKAFPEIVILFIFTTTNNMQKITVRMRFYSIYPIYVVGL